MRIGVHINLARQAHPRAATVGWEQNRYNNTAGARDGQSLGRPAQPLDAV
jgi:hypothetical protein